MKMIDQSAELIAEDYQYMLKQVQNAGRNCYDSYDRVTEGSAEKLIKNFIKRGHESPLEFTDMTFNIVTSRAVMAEITRHRLASFCVRSQRYCCEDNEYYGMTVIKPDWFAENTQAASEWMSSMVEIENHYRSLKQKGMKNEQAREVLPNCCSTRIVMKANVREWRHFFKMRCSIAAYPQMRSLAKEMLKQAYQHAPAFFEDLAQEFLQ